ncbi:uncharacterized protein LOC135474572 isoform X2 [Liolophura sinensis]|uniref:uncharacterized protein LOC135474572 isoform X2 n=1 Tax=Liolophura sinensis TaxID=3198878 RepID=UPI0031591322
MGPMTGTTRVRHCASKNGTPWYWNEIEKRCETCSLNVCKMSRYLPEACRCFCKNEWPSGEYPVMERECGDATPMPTNEGGLSSEHSVPVWVVVLIALFVIGIGLVVLLVKRKIIKSKITKYCRKQSVSTITGVTSEGWIPPSASGQPTGNAREEAPFIEPPMLKIRLTRPTQPENRPTQATEDNTKGEETTAKTSLIEPSEEESRIQRVPRQTVGPSYPSEGAPGGKYNLIHQDNTADIQEHHHD